MGETESRIEAELRSMAYWTIWRISFSLANETRHALKPAMFIEAWTAGHEAARKGWEAEEKEGQDHQNKIEGVAV